jgi:hypothetical protein
MSCHFRCRRVVCVLGVSVIGRRCSFGFFNSDSSPLFFSLAVLSFEWTSERGGKSKGVLGLSYGKSKCLGVRSGTSEQPLVPKVKTHEGE